MADGFEWFFWTSSALLALVASWLLYWSMLHDRARGRQRCPKCWYDMSESPALTCSECGCVVKHERKVHQTRRRWRWACVAILLMGVAGANAMTPKVRRNGWTSILPTTALIMLLPETDDSTEIPQWQTDVLNELLYGRLMWGEVTNDKRDLLWDWQWTFLLRATLNRCGESPEVLVSNRGSLYNELLEIVVYADAISRPELAAEMRQRFLGRAVGLEFQGDARIGEHAAFEVSHYGFPFDYPWDDYENYWDHTRIRVTDADTGREYRWRRNRVPYNLMCATGQPMFGGLVELPDEARTYNLIVTFEQIVKDRGESGREHMHVVSSASVQGTVVQNRVSDETTTAVSSAAMENTLLENVRWMLACYEDYECSVEVNFGTSDDIGDSIGQIWELQLVHGDTIVSSDHREMNLEYGDELTFDIGLPMSKLPPSATEDDGTWKLRLFADPHSMSAWDKLGQYWAGVIQAPIDWERTRASESYQSIGRENIHLDRDALGDIYDWQ